MKALNFPFFIVVVSLIWIDLTLALPSLFKLHNYPLLKPAQPLQVSVSSVDLTTSPLGPIAIATHHYSSPVSSSLSLPPFHRAKAQAPVNVEAASSAASKVIDDITVKDKAAALSNQGKVDKTPQPWLQRLINGLQFPFIASSSSSPSSPASSSSSSPFSNPISEEAELLENEKPVSLVDMSQYEDEVVLRFNWTNLREQRAFKNAAETLVLDIWTIGNDYGDIRISRSRIKDFIRLLPKTMKSRRTTIISDLQMAVFANYPLMDKGNNNNNNRNRLLKLLINDDAFFSDYRTFHEINAWINLLPIRYSGDFINIESVGKSHEGREIKVIHIGKPMIKPKPTIVVVSGIQGREWSSIMSGLYIINQLLIGEHDESLLEKVDFLFVPILNPDGFVYTWEHDRLWRKNRQPTGMAICSGIDIDHSFSYQWQQTTGCTPCSETYGGTRPHEALEALYLSNYLNISDKNVVGYLQFGLYSQTVLYPGHGMEKIDDDSDGYEEMKEFAEDLVSSIGVGTATASSSSSSSIVSKSKFLIGDMSISRDGARGGSNVNVMHSRGANSLQITMPNIDDYGYLVPKKYLVSMAKELYELLQSYCNLSGAGMV